MAKHKLNHRRKKKIEKHQARKRAWAQGGPEIVEEPPIWYYEDGGLLSVDWSAYDCEYWAEHDWSAAGQNALRWQRFFESLGMPSHYEESRKRRMETMRDREQEQEQGSVIYT